ncbi:outer membrane beta-barrel protein [Mongoliitalea lutea]|jgi:hypothetical protein|uniref:Outer membrane protein beta-barrel domain-containing protein n=1 Tax=Mongoliitalea lutea TaxID=849756 RepID=A0A8J3CUB4_9BACT|nr:outer membrane beta-barrel protein [Mongoliitalea lutea]GHB27276.1 hypothetical protein GCM10008106_05010 [Mongoliitalea lutea]
MKKITIALLLIMVAFSANAQYKGQFRFIHSYEMTSDKGFFGMSFGGEYLFQNYLSIHPSMTFYTPATGNARGFDVNMRYYLTEKEKQWYTLIGYGHYTRVFEFNPERIRRHNSVNLGAGGMLKFRDELGINPEIRYQPMGRNEVIFKLAIVYFIN